MSALPCKILQDHPEFDYQSIIHLLSETHKYPRRKLQDLQKSKVVIRIKKGFYVLNPEFSRLSYSSEIVANLIYGPSYLSLEYALSYYQIIPERVEQWTSVTVAKNKNFITPIGAFSFNHLHPDIYPLGIVQKEAHRGVYFLMATLEKAVLDYLILKTDDHFFKSPEDLPVFFEQDLRADWADLTTAMDANVLQSWLPHYARRKRIKWFIQLIIKGKK